MEILVCTSDFWRRLHPGTPQTNIRRGRRQTAGLRDSLEGDFGDLAEYCFFFFVSYPVVGAGFAARFVIVLPWEESREQRAALPCPARLPAYLRTRMPTSARATFWGNSSD
jgi:hypothetical protein